MHREEYKHLGDVQASTAVDTWLQHPASESPETLENNQLVACKANGYELLRRTESC